jgi:hypothetical protein
MSTATELFADVDRMDATVFASHLAQDASLRFGNGEELTGREAIEAYIAGFFATIDNLSHEIVSQWELDDTTILRLEVTYTRQDGRIVTIPVVTIYRRGPELIDDYRVFIDPAPIYA